MKNKAYYQRQLLECCFQLHAKKWWKPAVVQRILIGHYVGKYMETIRLEEERRFARTHKKMMD